MTDISSLTPLPAPHQLLLDSLQLSLTWSWPLGCILTPPYLVSGAQALALGYTREEEPVHTEISSSTNTLVPGRLSTCLLLSSHPKPGDSETLGTLWGKEIALVSCILITQTPDLGLAPSTYQ